MELWFLACKNLWRNPRRTIVTAIALSTGFAGLCLFHGFTYRTEKALAIGTIYINQTGHISIIKKGWLEKGLSKPKKYSITDKEQLSIQNFLSLHLDQIQHQFPMLIGVGLISNGCRTTPYYMKGLPNIYRKNVLFSDEFLKWRNFNDRNFAGKDYTHFNVEDAPILITENLARLLNKKSIYTSFASLPKSSIIDCMSNEKYSIISTDPSVQLMTKTFDNSFTAMDANVVGHFMVGFSFLEDMGMEAPLSFVQKLYDTESISRWIIYLKDPHKSLNFWKNSIYPTFSKEFPQLEMLFYNDEKISPFYVGTSQFLKSLTLIFIIIAGAAASLAIINSLTLSIIERSKEIGTLRSLGFTESKLALLFGKEMILLSFFSLAFGWMLSLLLSFLINQSHLTFEPPGATEPVKLEISMDYIFQVKIFLILLGIVAFVSFYLTKKQIRTSIAQLLIET